MANTFANLVPIVTERLDVISRELVGIIPAVNRDSTADRVAKDQTLYSPVVPAFGSSSTITPAATMSFPSDTTVGNKSVTISNFKKQAFYWTGEEAYTLNAGVGASGIVGDQIEQAIRSLVNEMESGVWAATYAGASRAYGTAATTPFGSDLSDIAQVRKILDDNGAPMANRSLVIDTTAGAKLRTLGQLTKANEASDTSMLRQGTLLDVHGFSIRESAAVGSVTKGTGASYLVNNASGLAVGATTVAADTGSGTILAGDMVTFGSDTTKYVVATALSGGSFTIAAPGIRTAVADNATITVVGTSTRNVALSRNAVLLATRLPQNGNDGASNRIVVTDPRSGLSFEFSEYPVYRATIYEIAVAWGVSVIKPEHIAVLLG